MICCQKPSSTLCWCLVSRRAVHDKREAQPPAWMPDLDWLSHRTKKFADLARRLCTPALCLDPNCCSTRAGLTGRLRERTDDAAQHLFPSWSHLSISVGSRQLRWWPPRGSRAGQTLRRGSSRGGLSQDPSGTLAGFGTVVHGISCRRCAHFSPSAWASRRCNITFKMTKSSAFCPALQYPHGCTAVEHAVGRCRSGENV